MTSPATISINPVLPAPVLAYPTPYAGFWRRYAAALIDGLILGIATYIPSAVVGVVLGVIESVLFKGLPEMMAMTAVINGLVGMVVGVAITLGYYAFFETRKNGVTPGRQVLGLALQAEDGEPITLKTSIIRQLVRFVSGLVLCIGYLIQPFTEKRQTAHDMVSHCLMVRTREQATWIPWAINLGYFVLTLGFAVAYVVLIAGAAMLAGGGH
jgi:uncharacterized RDD family membrane protein YckC